MAVLGRFLLLGGITPAWAGKRAWRPGSSQRGRDHPRMGGEKLLGQQYIHQHLGSPPHGRGKAAHELRTLPRAGITPAWAGKRWFQLIFVHCLEDHPRMGGEKRWRSGSCGVKLGSPPHGRGKGGYGWLMLTLTGITPAWAGKSCPAARMLPRTRDHPRVGGEKGSTSIVLPMTLGSPPHRRGKAVPIAAVPIAAGITPA